MKNPLFDHISLPMILVLALGLTTSMLTAQPQVLPKIELGSEASLRIPLVIKPIELNLIPVADSLSSDLPPALAFKHHPPAWKASLNGPLSLNLAMSSASSASLRMSWYPTGGMFSLLSGKLIYLDPDAQNSLLDLSLTLSHRLSGSSAVSHTASYQKHSLRATDQDLASYSLYWSAPTLRIGELAFSDLKTDLGFDYRERELTAMANKDFALDLSLANTTRWREHRLDSEVALQGKNVGAEAVYLLPRLPRAAGELALGLLTDFHHWLPAVDYHSRFTLSRGWLLAIVNRSALAANPMTDLGRKYPWAALPRSNDLTLRPLNLSVGLSNAPRSLPLLKEIALTNTLGYSVNQPLQADQSGNVDNIVIFRDLFSESCALKLSLEREKIKVKQEIAFNLEFLPERGWIRRPYSPAVTASTQLVWDLGQAELVCDLKQLYLQRDKAGNPLPEIFDLGCELKYPPGGKYNFALGFRNLFNSPYLDYGPIPGTGRRVYLAFQLRP